MRAVRVGVAAGVSAFVGYLVKDPNVPLWLTPILVAQRALFIFLANMQIEPNWPVEATAFLVFSIVSQVDLFGFPIALFYRLRPVNSG